MTRRPPPVAAGRIILAACEATPEQGGAELESQSAAVTAGTRLISAQSGRCLDVSQNSQTSGQGLNIYDCHGQGNQRFLFTPEGELRVFDGAWCVQPATATAGARAVISACTGATSQRWVRNLNGTVVHTASSLCLDVSGGATAWTHGPACPPT